MLEHLHRDHPVEGIVDGEIVHVGGDDPHVAENLFPLVKPACSWFYLQSTHDDEPPRNLIPFINLL
jgi:hypothetical protein